MTRKLAFLATLTLACQVAVGCGDDDGGGTTDADTDTDTDTDSDTDSDSDTDTDTDTDTDSDTDSDTDPECTPDTVTHPVTSVEWRRCSEGATWEWDGEECACVGGLTTTYPFAALAELCGTGFHPATAEELLSLLDGCTPTWDEIATAGTGECDSCAASEVCTEMFPGEARFFWSSTEFGGDTSLAFVVGFNLGDVDAMDKTNSYYVRCVED